MGFAARSLLMLSTAMRLRVHHREVPAQGRDAAVPLPQDGQARPSGLLVEFLFWVAPLICCFLLFTWMWIGRNSHRFGIVLPDHFVPWLLVALGVTWAARIGFRYYGDFEPAQVKDLLADQSVSQMRTRAVEIEGEIAGNANPEARWSPDLIMKDDTGSMLLHYRSSIPLARLAFAFHTADRLVGQPVKVQGWYRRGSEPYIEISRIEACVAKPTADTGLISLFGKEGDRRQLQYEFLVERSYSRWIQLQLSAACAAAGIVWLLGLY
jgi:hypothetical protein